MLPPKKSLGQNFLNSETALAKIVGAAELSAGDIVVEVGPGHGALTKKLLETGANVIAVEKDEQLVDELRQTFAHDIKNSKLRLISADILETRMSDVVGSNKFSIVANLPYYITGQFIRKFLGNDPQPQKMVLLLQKEVAERICANDNKESLLSISIKAYGNPTFVDTVEAENFYPKPKVDSAIIKIDEISRKKLENINETHFFDILHRGFAHKRKLLRGNLEIPSETLEKCSISPSARPENLTISDWLHLALKI